MMFTAYTACVYAENMQSICSVYAVFMQCLCSVYAVFMQCLCSVYAVFMQCLCSVYAVFMQCLCSVYAVFMQYICSVYCHTIYPITANLGITSKLFPRIRFYFTFQRFHVVRVCRLYAYFLYRIS